VTGGERYVKDPTGCALSGLGVVVSTIGFFVPGPGWVVTAGVAVGVASSIHSCQ